MELFKSIKAEYAFNDDVMSSDEPRVARLKYIVQYRLDLADRTIFLLYVDTLSLRKVAAMVGVSHATIRSWVMRIKKQILDEYGKMD